MHYLFPADAVWDVNFSPDPAERHVKVNGVALPCSLVSVEMEARRRGYNPTQLGWHHHHPVSGWSSIDVNTLRQRVHELEMNEVLQAFAFVLTPSGIRARWDRSGPGQGDNAYVDQIPVLIGTPDMLEVAEEAKAEVKELLARRPAPKKRSQRPADPVHVPKAEWRRQPGILPFEYHWEEMTFGEPLEEMVLGELIRERLGAIEDPAAYVCRKDPKQLTDLDACISCPFGAECFAINTGDWDDMYRRLLEEIYG